MLNITDYLAHERPTLPLVGLSVVLILLGVATTRIVHSLFFHPLRHYPGPWYAACSSLPLGLASVTGNEPHWLLRIARKYGKDGSPVRITPNLLFFHKASTLRDIYWDPKCNQKSTMYGHEAIGPTSIFQILDGQEHKVMRKALGGGPWAIGTLKKTWEPAVDGLVRAWKANQLKYIERGETVVLSNKVAEFAADVMTMVLFTQPWGFVRNDRDERGMLQAWRDGLPLFGLSQRWRFFREVVLTSPLAAWVLPKESDSRGNGWLVHQAKTEIAEREKKKKEKKEKDHNDPASASSAPPFVDFLQLTIDAHVDGSPLSPVQKLANITIFIQAGADTTGSGLGATLRFLATRPDLMARARDEIDAADAAGRLSDPVQYDETRDHLPFMCAVIRESLRLNPPIPNIFPRLAPAGGKLIDGHFVPAGTEMTSQSYVASRDADVFGAEPDHFNPDRWLVDEDEVNRMDAAMFTFGMGPRICIGKDIALLELHKLVPEIIRCFNIEVIQEGRYVVVGGIAHHDPPFLARLNLRKGQC